MEPSISFNRALQLKWDVINCFLEVDYEAYKGENKTKKGKKETDRQIDRKMNKNEIITIID